MVKDPGERTNIAAEDQRVLAEMRQAMKQHAAELTQPSNVDPEEAANFAALGYLGQVRTQQEDTEALADPKDRIAALEQLRVACDLERRGDVGGAIAGYQSIVANNPKFADAWFRLAVAQEKTGGLQEAIRSYRAGINAAPMLAQQMAIAVGSLHVRLRQLEDADAHARLALKTQPGAAHHLLGRRVALARGDGAGAQREARLAMQDSLYREAGGVLLALTAIEQGRPAEALQLLDEIRKSSRTPVPDLDSTRGDALARMERFAEGEAAFRSEISAFPHNREAYTRLAILYATLGRAAEVESTLERMFSAKPSASTAELAASVELRSRTETLRTGGEQRAARMR